MTTDEERELRERVAHKIRFTGAAAIQLLPTIAELALPCLKWLLERRSRQYALQLFRHLTDTKKHFCIEIYPDHFEAESIGLVLLLAVDGIKVKK